MQMQQSLKLCRRRFLWRLLMFIVVVFVLPATFMMAEGVALRLMSYDSFGLPAIVPYVWLGVSFFTAIRTAFSMRQYTDALRRLPKPKD